MTNDNIASPAPAPPMSKAQDCRLRADQLDAAAAGETTDGHRAELQLLAAEWRRLAVVADWQESLIAAIDET